MNELTKEEYAAVCRKVEEFRAKELEKLEEQRKRAKEEQESFDAEHGYY